MHSCFIDALFTIVKQSTLTTTKKGKVTADVLDRKFTTQHYFYRKIIKYHGNRKYTDNRFHRERYS